MKPVEQEQARHQVVVGERLEEWLARVLRPSAIWSRSFARAAPWKSRTAGPAPGPGPWRRDRQTARAPGSRRLEPLELPLDFVVVR